MRDLLISCPRKKSRGFFARKIHQQGARRYTGACKVVNETPRGAATELRLAPQPHVATTIRCAAARRGGTAPSPSALQPDGVGRHRPRPAREKTTSFQHVLQNLAGRHARRAGQLGFCRAREALCPDERGSGAEMTYFFQRAASGCASPRYAPQRSVLTSPKNPGRTS